MFDLELQIQSWRTAVAKNLGERTELLDELESHLRDDFEQLMKDGQSQEESWGVALRRLGDPQVMAGEFARLDKAVWLPAWVAGIALALFVLAMAWFAISRLAAGRIGPLLAFHILFVTTGYLSVFAVGFLAFWAVLVRAVARWDERHSIALRRTGVRLALIAVVTTAVGIVLGACWSHEHLGRWWGWDPREIGGLCVLAWSCLLWRCFRSPSSNTQSLTAMALMGNIVVCLSWFGAWLLTSASRADGASLYGVIIGAFVITQLLAICLYMLPARFLRRGPSEFGRTI